MRGPNAWARLYNLKEDHPVPIIYGCVTTGEDWQFLTLQDQLVTINTQRYYLNQPGELLAVFDWIVEQLRDYRVWFDRVTGSLNFALQRFGYTLLSLLQIMELTIKVDDKEGPFVIELLKRFSFVQEVKQSGQPFDSVRVDELWHQKAEKMFAERADFDLWLSSPNRAIQQRTPISLLSDEEGYQTVSKLLGRLEHGIMA